MKMGFYIFSIAMKTHLGKCLLLKFIIGLFACLVSLPVLWNFIKPYQRERVISFLNPESDPLGNGYQLIQSKIALGSGSLTGKGFLKGTQSYLEYLPEKQTDFIFTLIGEEFGFIGSIFIISLFFIIISISFYISIKSNNLFGRILAIGISCSGASVNETLIVSPRPSSNKVPIPNADFTLPSIPSPASVTPKCNG